MFKKFTWGHGVIVALGTFIAFILFMIFVFTRGWKNSELVSKDYYQDELTYQSVIDSKKNADNLPEKPNYTQTANGIAVHFPKSIVPDGNTAHFELFRTDDSNLDVKKDLTLDQDHSIQIPKKVLVKGSYTLKIKWQQNKTPYQIDYDVLWK